jgi:hypothetical protein
MRARQRHLNPKAAGAAVVFDARYITGLSDGGNVSSWNDRSGNANNATTASNYPTYETNEQAGNPVVRFVSANATNLLCSTYAYSGTNQKFLIAVYKSTATSASYANAAAGQSGATNFHGWFTIMSRKLTNSVSDPYISTYGGDTRVGKSPPDNLWKVATGAHDGTTLYTRKNCVEIDAIARTSNVNTSAFRIGIDDLAGTLISAFEGDIAYIAAGQATYSLPLIRRLEHAMGLSYKIACS